MTSYSNGAWVAVYALINQVNTMLNTVNQGVALVSKIRPDTLSAAITVLVNQI